MFFIDVFTSFFQFILIYIRRFDGGKFLILLPILVIAVINDLTVYRINNKLILFGIISGLGSCVLTLGITGIFVFLSGFLIPVLMLMMIYAAGGIGAGDVKLFGVIGGLIGIRGVFSCIIYAFIIGAAIGLIKIIINKKFLMYLNNLTICISTFMYSHKILRLDKTENTKIHFSIPILFGVILYGVECHI